MKDSIISLYSPDYTATLVCMMQDSNYQARPFLKRYWRTSDFSKAKRQRQLKRTRSAKLLMLGLTTGMLIQVLAGLLSIVWGIWFHLGGGTLFGLSLILSYPVIWAHLGAGFLPLRRVFLAKSGQKKRKSASR